MSLKPFFAPQSVAVVGASSVPGKSGHIILKNLVELGFAGEIFPINPKADAILGKRCYPDMAACPAAPELAVLAVPREHVPAMLRQVAEKGTRHAIIATAGFSDTGDELGLDLENQILEIAAANNMRLMGPNSIGTIDTTSRLITSITHNDPLPAGPVSFFGQTGLFASGITRWIYDSQPFGVAKIACLGNKNDVGEIDLLHYLAEDEATGVIGCYLEGVGDGRRFLDAARTAAARKPLVVLKGGASTLGGEAAAGHTGALAGDSEVFAGVLRQAGAVSVSDLSELFDLLAGFAHGPLPNGRNLGAISITGAGCVLSADAAERFGLALPEFDDQTYARMREVCPDWAPLRNPVDIWSSIEKSGVEESYRQIGLAVAQDPSIDMLLMAITLFPGSIFDISSIIREIREAAPEKPVVTVLLGGGCEENRDWTRNAHRAGAATYPSIPRAVQALAAMVEYRDRRRRF